MNLEGLTLGLYWCIAGDTNQLKLDPILHLNPNLRSVVTKPTRINTKNPKKSSILDNIITDLHQWYQEPIILPPIAADPGQGKPSDHLKVIYKPLNPLNNKPYRQVRKIEVRPMKESGMNLLKVWLDNKHWDEIEETSSPHHKAKLLHSTLMSKINEVIPVKTIKVSNDDQPWCNDQVKNIKRLKQREYRKHRRSDIYLSLCIKYKALINKAKSKYYKHMIRDLKKSNPRQWYSKLKRMSSPNPHLDNKIVVEEIMHLTDQEQADAIAKRMAKISQEYNALNACDLQVPPFDSSTIPQFSQVEVKNKLLGTKTNKAAPPGDVPPKIIKMFAEQISFPLPSIINSSISSGIWPNLWKIESVTPVPKVHPHKLLKHLKKHIWAGHLQ